MTLHLKSRGYPFRPRLLFSSFIVVGFGSPNCVLFQERTSFDSSEVFIPTSVENKKIPTEEIRFSSVENQNSRNDWSLSEGICVSVDG